MAAWTVVEIDKILRILTGRKNLKDHQSQNGLSPAEPTGKFWRIDQSGSPHNCRCKSYFHGEQARQISPAENDGGNYTHLLAAGSEYEQRGPDVRKRGQNQSEHQNPFRKGEQADAAQSPRRVHKFAKNISNVCRKGA